MKRLIYTIGYGSRLMDEFVQLLQQNEISYLIDIRSKPYSKYKPEFSKSQLESHLQAENIQYVFMGGQLGGQPDLPSVLTPDGKVDYEKLKEKEFYKQGIERLHKALDQNLLVAIMCSEGKPEMCHRSKLIGETLHQDGINVLHIDESGEVVSQAQILHRLTGGQMSMFDSDQSGFTSRKKYQNEGPDEGEE